MGFGTGLLQTAVLGLVITAAWLYTRTETEHTAAIAQCAVDSARMDEQIAEARLQMLEAQSRTFYSTRWRTSSVFMRRIERQVRECSRT